MNAAEAAPLTAPTEYATGQISGAWQPPPDFPALDFILAEMFLRKILDSTRTPIGIIDTAPESITSYLSSNFFFLYTAGAVWQLWKIKANWSGAIIVLYKHPSRGLYLHYVAGIKTSNGLFRFYNDYYYDKAYSRKQPISLQKYIDLLKANGCHMVAFWGVAKKKGWW